MYQYLVDHESVLIQFDCQQTKRFFYFWLADNCPQNYHCNGQKRTQSSDVSLSIQPKLVELIDEELVIHWEDKISYYPIPWLKQFIPQKSAERNEDVQIWENLQHIPMFDYQEIFHDEAELLRCLLQIKQFGFAKINCLPVLPNTILNLIDLFGYVKETNYGKVYNLISIKDGENEDKSNFDLPCHTENPYQSPLPTIQLLHCLSADVEGGETRLVDGFYIAEKIRQTHPEYFHLLTTKEIEFQFKTDHHDLYSRSPIIQLNQCREVVRVQFNSRSVQPFKMNDEDLRNFYQAYQYFEQQIEESKHQVRFKLNAGEAIIFDNERILHGRTKYKLLGERHLQGCYSDKDGLLSKIRVLQRELGVNNGATNRYLESIL